MPKLYIAAENIPAGHYVVATDPPSEYVRGRSPFDESGRIVVAVGIAEENLREGFRIAVDGDGKAREDDA